MLSLMGYLLISSHSTKHFFLCRVHCEVLLMQMFWGKFLMAFHMVRNRNAGRLRLLHIYNSILQRARKKAHLIHFKGISC